MFRIYENEYGRIVETYATARPHGVSHLARGGGPNLRPATSREHERQRKRNSCHDSLDERSICRGEPEFRLLLFQQQALKAERGAVARKFGENPNVNIYMLRRSSRKPFHLQAWPRECCVGRGLILLL